MPKMIQIRNVPDDIHRIVKSRAALAGMSLSDYLLVEVRKVADRPTMEELRQRIARLTPIELDPSSAEVIREERDQP